MIRARLLELGLVLPQAATPRFAYVPVVVDGGVAYVSGQLPWVSEGVLFATGKVGEGVDVETAQEAARLCVLQGLAALEAAVGDLVRVRRVLKVTGFVASAPAFTGQPRVIDAASKLLIDLFGDAGRHARSAVGVAVLPRDVPVEIEFVFAVDPGRDGVSA